jgi:hypothetical protein
VHVDGREIYSKLKTGEFPEPSAILGALTARG